jgi:S-adenosylmethionine:tRNA ribosyltransferase-isomerase
MVRPGGKLRPGHVVEIADDLRVEILDATPAGNRIVRLDSPLEPDAALAKHGLVPLPPYLGRDAEDEDRERYQTVYARERGSVAAPTAGLHFTPELLAALEVDGVVIARIVLHVGIGTFRPVEAEDPAEHRLHAERYRVPQEAADAINRARAAGGRVWAVGTTVTRTLETVADDTGRIVAGEGETSLFIRPGYRFRAVDRLLTNFHLPRSSLLMLVAAFAGLENIRRAYAHAIERRYRFFSYGDAMLIEGRT